MKPRRIALAATVMLLCAGCAEEPSTPQATVGQYLKYLGRDPMRVLPLLSDDFHRAHGMLFANTARLPHGMAKDARIETAVEDSDYDVERHRLGWLMAPAHVDPIRAMMPRLRELQLAWLSSEQQADRAQVALRSWVEGDEPVDVVFRLRREDASSPWRIDGVDKAPSSSAYVRFSQYLLAPDLAGVRFIAQQAEHLAEPSAQADAP